MRVVFVKSDSIGSRLIRAFEGSTASHCGVVLPGNMVLDASWPDGVRVQTWTEFFRNREMVDDVTFSLPDEGAALRFLTAQVGKPYDVGFIVSFLLWRDISSNRRWACSELVRTACQYGNRPYIGRPNRYGLRLLHEVCFAWQEARSP